MELKQISVLHPEGEWEDVRIAQELRSTPMKAVAFPRELLPDVRREGKKDASVLPNIDVPGVYLLLGRSEKMTTKAFVYIGQSIKGVGSRLAQHDTKNPYPWWTDTIAFIKDDTRLHDGLISHVESSLIRSGDLNPQWEIQQNNPSEDAGNLSPEDRLLWRDLVPNVKKIIGTLGWNVFSNFASEMRSSTASQAVIPSTPEIPIFECKGKGKGYRATMHIVNSEEFVVEEGSTAWAETLSTIRKSIRHAREELIEKKILRREPGNLLKFTNNHTFASAWKAASIISGGPIDGDRAWKSPSGETYGEWKKRNSDNGGTGNARTEPINQNKQTGKTKWKSPEFTYCGSGFDAKMQINKSGKFVVKQTSKANIKTSPSTSRTVKTKREELCRNKTLRREGDFLVFINDQEFSSPRASASTVRGHDVNGNNAWKLPDGRTLGQWQFDQKQKSGKRGSKSNS